MLEVDPAKVSVPGPFVVKPPVPVIVLVVVTLPGPVTVRRKPPLVMTPFKVNVKPATLALMRLLDWRKIGPLKLLLPVRFSRAPAALAVAVQVDRFGLRIVDAAVEGERAASGHRGGAGGGTKSRR